MLAAFTNSFTGQGGLVQVLISLAALVSGIIFYFKKTRIEEIQTVGTVHLHQIESLMTQVTMLQKELALARDQLSEIHNQDMKLMTQIRDQNMRIQELEYLLHSHPEITQKDDGE